MSVQIDYSTIAIISAASGFFGAFGAEIAKYLITALKARSEEIKKRAKEMME